MKHIFYVHSHITFLVSKQYILDKEINPDDCLFLCSRKYEPSYKFQQIFKNIIRYPQDIFGQKKDFSLLENICTGFKDISVIENIINSFCQNDTFILYTYSTNSHLCSVLVSMAKCKCYFIIEEGSSAYADNLTVKNLISKKNLLLQSFLVHFIPRFYILKDHHLSTSSEKYKGTIATSEHAFFQMEGEHIVISNPFNREKLPYSPTAVLSIDASPYICKVETEYILMTIPDMKQRFGVKVGLSDHTEGYTVPMAAVALGAEVVEKHFIIDRSIGGPDSAFSMEADEFKLMVENIRKVEAALGSVNYPTNPAKIKGREFCRSLYVAEDIKAGDVITEKNVRSVRPGYGLHPKYLTEILGRKVNRDLKVGDRMCWEVIL